MRETSEAVDVGEVRPLRYVVKQCRKGHPRTARNVVRTGRGRLECRECLQARRPLKTRACKGCKQPFAGSRGKYCQACVTLRHMDDMEVSHKPIRTRTCTECHETRPLAYFSLPVKGMAGVPRYADRCADCRDEDDEGFPPDSPYEKARVQVERIFGRPASEWINSRGHVLSDLHFLRMLAIQHAEARRTGSTLTRPELDTRSRTLWPRLARVLPDLRRTA